MTSAILMITPMTTEPREVTCLIPIELWEHYDTQLARNILCYKQSLSVNACPERVSLASIEENHEPSLRNSYF